MSIYAIVRYFTIFNDTVRIWCIYNYLQWYNETVVLVAIMYQNDMLYWYVEFGQSGVPDHLKSSTCWLSLSMRTIKIKQSVTHTITKIITKYTLRCHGPLIITVYEISVIVITHIIASNVNCCCSLTKSAGKSREHNR